MSSISNEKLKELVDSWRKKRQEKPLSEQTKDREGRVYVNRSVLMGRIKYIGFDMDHTLIVYKSPEYDMLAYDLTLDRLVNTGYPKSIKDIKYDSSFAIRGLFFDRKFGNLLKLDAFGNILSCCHGFTILTPHEIRKYYPNKYIQPGDPRLFIMDTLYHCIEIFLLAALVKYFDEHQDYVRITDGPSSHTGVQSGDIVITYQMIQQDVRSAIHWVHTEGDVKKKTIEDLPKYVVIDERFPSFIKCLCESGRKLFIATNSGYDYTMKIMSFLFNETFKSEVDWRKYFDFIIVNAQKPLFFQEGTMLREIDETTGSLRLGRFTGNLTKGKVFSGGSSDTLCKIAGVEGKEILYVGDHIFGDIIKSKKEQAFRTFLVVPEMTSEIATWENAKVSFVRLQNLEFLLSEMYQGAGSHDYGPDVPSVESLRKSIKETAQAIESMYPHAMGSLLRCGSRLTYFANQVSRFADLYSSTCVNLVNYPSQYLFSSPHQLMAHESDFSENTGMAEFKRTTSTLKKGMSTVIVDFVDEDSDESNPIAPEH